MIHPDYAEMGIDARPESRRGYSEEDSFERLGGTGFSLGTSSGGDCLSIPTPLSLDAAPPSLNFSTPHFSNFSMEESNHLFDETHSTPFEQQTSTFLPDNTDFNLNHTWDTDSFFTHNGIDPSSTDIDSRLQPRLALGSNDFRNACGNSTDGGASGKRNTLILEDLYPETVNDVMAAMFKSNTKFKMRLYSQD